MYNDIQPEPPLSEPEPRDGAVAPCLCCNQRWYANEIQWFDCEHCENKVCPECATDRDGHVLCKNCKDCPQCPACGSFRYVVREQAQIDEFAHYEERYLLECIPCDHTWEHEE